MSDEVMTDESIRRGLKMWQEKNYKGFVELDTIFRDERDCGMVRAEEIQRQLIT